MMKFDFFKFSNCPIITPFFIFWTRGNNGTLFDEKKMSEMNSFFLICSTLEKNKNGQKIFIPN